LIHFYKRKHGEFFPWFILRNQYTLKKKC